MSTNLEGLFNKKARDQTISEIVNVILDGAIPTSETITFSAGTFSYQLSNQPAIRIARVVGVLNGNRNEFVVGEANENINTTTSDLYLDTANSTLEWFQSGGSAVNNVPDDGTDVKVHYFYQGAKSTIGDMSRGTLQRFLVDALGYSFDDVYNILEEIYNSGFVALVTDDYSLDQLAWIFGPRHARIEAEKARGVVRFTSDDLSASVAQGVIVRVGTGGSAFRTIESKTAGSVPGYFVDVRVQAEVDGVDGNAVAGSVNFVQTAGYDKYLVGNPAEQAYVILTDSTGLPILQVYAQTSGPWGNDIQITLADGGGGSVAATVIYPYENSDSYTTPENQAVEVAIDDDLLSLRGAISALENVTSTIEIRGTWLKDGSSYSTLREPHASVAAGATTITLGNNGGGTWYGSNYALVTGSISVYADDDGHEDDDDYFDSIVSASAGQIQLKSTFPGGNIVVSYSMNYSGTNMPSISGTNNNGGTSGRYFTGGIGAFIDGRDRETVTEMKERLRTVIDAEGDGNYGAIEQSVGAISGIDNCTVQDYSRYPKLDLATIRVIITPETFPIYRNSPLFQFVTKVTNAKKAAGIRPVIISSIPRLVYILAEAYSLINLDSNAALVDTAISSYINSLSVGDDMVWSEMVRVSMSVRGIRDFRVRYARVTDAINLGSQSTVDVAIDKNAVTRLYLAQGFKFLPKVVEEKYLSPTGSNTLEVQHETQTTLVVGVWESGDAEKVADEFYGAGTASGTTVTCESTLDLNKTYDVVYGYYDKNAVFIGARFWVKKEDSQNDDQILLAQIPAPDSSGDPDLSTPINGDFWPYDLIFFDDLTASYQEIELLVSTFLDQVWLYDESADTFTDVTTESQDATASDVVLPNVALDAIYFGCTLRFSSLVFKNLTVGTGTSGLYSFQYWNGSVWTPLTVKFDLTRVKNTDYCYYYDDSALSYLDKATDWNNKAGGPITLPGADINDQLYVGDTHKFSKIYFKVSTAHVPNSSTYTFQYYNGSTWQTLTLVNDGLVDGTSNMTESGFVSFNPPSDWVTGSSPGVSAYWIRVVIDAIPTTDAVINHGGIYYYPQSPSFGNSGNQPSVIWDIPDDWVEHIGDAAIDKKMYWMKIVCNTAWGTSGPDCDQVFARSGNRDVEVVDTASGSTFWLVASIIDYIASKAYVEGDLGVSYEDGVCKDSDDGTTWVDVTDGGNPLDLKFKVLKRSIVGNNIGVNRIGDPPQIARVGDIDIDGILYKEDLD